jgi:predicted MPP superfamily phosphohydrolase
MLSINFTYSFPFHRKLLKIQRNLWGLLLFGPVAFALIVGFDLVSLGKAAMNDGSFAVPVAYAWICIGVGGMIFPAITLLRLIKQRPKVIIAERCVTVDVAKELGHRPVGDGRYRRIAESGINDLFRVDFTTLTLAVPGLPKPLDGLSILHLSDLHFYGTPGREYFDFIVRRAMSDGAPDLLVVSGDVIDDNKYLDWIEPVLSSLRWNVAALAIMGNHDWWMDFEAVRSRLSALGMKVISNRWEAIDIRGETVVAIGHEGPWFRPPPDLSGCPTGFRILVSHTPDNIGWARRNHCGLMLSGHNHGGQIRIPIVGSLFVPSRFSRRYDMGTFHEPPTILHVNRGLSGKEPVRFRCRPQVTRMVLKSTFG